MSAAGWNQDEQRVRAHSCDIRDGSIGHDPGERCGRKATWWSDDVSPGSTVWMCERHSREINNSADVEMTEVDS